MNAELKSFGNRLRQLREERGMTQAELARELPVSEGQISRWERAYRGQGRVWKPDRQALIRILTIFSDGLDPVEACTLSALAGYKLTQAEIDSLFPPEPGSARRPQVEATTPPTAYWQNLPVATTSFVGRVKELEELGELICDPTARLITVLGAGGIGKTRLALTAAEKYATAFRNGVLFASLAGISDAHFLPSSMIAALDLRFPDQQNHPERLLAFLRDMELLLVLDNYEQLLPDVEFLTRLLHTASAVKILVTSRERLEIQAESLLELAGLDYPHSLTQPSSRVSLTDYSALQLFVQRARQVQRHLALSEADTAAILRIGRITEGMPLALELAATAVRVHSCTAIADSLENGQQVLLTRLRDLPERQRSMPNVFEHSLRLLSAEERQTLGALALFRGGFTVEAANEITGASQQLLTTLLDKSLLRLSRTYRYDMHELMRQYVIKELEASSTFAHVHARYIAYFMGLARGAREGLAGAQPGTWFSRLVPEIDNLRAVLTWLKQHAPEDALAMVMDLFWLWPSLSSLQEGLDWILNLSSLDAPVSPALQADAYRAASFFALGLHKLDDAMVWITKSLTLYRTLDWTVRQNVEGYIFALTRQNFVLLHRDDYEQALAVGFDALKLAQDLDSNHYISFALYAVGEAQLTLEQYAAAKQSFQEGLRLMKEVGDLRSIGHRLARLSNIAVAEGEYEQARFLCHQTLTTCAESQDRVALTMTFSVVVTLAIVNGDFEQAALLLGAFEAVRDLSPFGGSFPHDRRIYSALVATLQAHLEAYKLEQLVAQGRILPVEQIIELALLETE